jgi:hypothetical protein
VYWHLAPRNECHTKAPASPGGGVRGSWGPAPQNEFDDLLEERRSRGPSEASHGGQDDGPTRKKAIPRQ